MQTRINRRAQVDQVAGCVLVLALALAAGCSKKETAQEQAPPGALASITIADTTFQTPESVLYVIDADIYLVSNINGSPGDKDNNGYISRVGADGRVLDGAWIAGGANGVFLDAPKGMAVTGDTLLVADIDVVRLFNLATGAPLGAWAVTGATFLNDMTSGLDGRVYFTDSGFTATAEGFAESGTDALYRFGPGGEAIVVAKDPSLGRPNGVCVAPDGVIVVTFGSGEVYRIDPATGARTNLPKPPTGQLDGVVRLADGSLLISSWEGSIVYRLDGAGTYSTVVDSVMSPADIGYDSKRERVLIPVFMGNRVEVRGLP
jgi:outer membrane protein assembly factor BamB